MSDTAIATVVAGLFLAAYAAFVIAAVVQVARSTGIARASKTAWIAGIVLVPLLGTVAWLLLGHRTPRVEDALRATRDGDAPRLSAVPVAAAARGL